MQVHVCVNGGWKVAKEKRGRGKFNQLGSLLGHTPEWDLTVSIKSCQSCICPLPTTGLYACIWWESTWLQEEVWSGMSLVRLKIFPSTLQSGLVWSCCGQSFWLILWTNILMFPCSQSPYLSSKQTSCYSFPAPISIWCLNHDWPFFWWRWGLPYF